MVWLRLVLLSSLAITISARHLQDAGLLEDGTLVNALATSTACPDGCMAGACVQNNGTSTCSQCMGTLLVSKVTGECVCPPGRYSLAGASDCTDCPKGSYCAGGLFKPSAQPPLIPSATPCPGNMTTLGLRSLTDRQCVNMPGFAYTLSANNTPGVVQCGADSYGPGFKKQRACVPCPAGTTTSNKVQQTSPNFCMVPEGYFLQGPGLVTPCTQGEYISDSSSSSTKTNCTKCAVGVTTARNASTSEADCKVLLPGFYAAEISTAGAVRRTGSCPQKYICSGGIATTAFDPLNPGALPATETTIKLCTNGTWTIGLGATTAAQCQTPPGFYTSGNSTLRCPPGAYRAGWQAAAAAASCQSCGDGVQADKRDSITMYSLGSNTTTALGVATSVADCYIQPGQGLVQVNQTWRADNCITNNYGVANRTYGLTANPCRSCPAGLVTDLSTGSSSLQFYIQNTDGSGGFVSDKACVNSTSAGNNSTNPGNTTNPGNNGTVTGCPQGTYQSGNTSTCVACPVGFTTAGAGAGLSLTDCGIAAGYGNVNGTVQLCPNGTYNPISWTPGSNATCTPCPAYTTTARPGAVLLKECVLLPGFFALELSTEGVKRAQMCPQKYYCPGGVPSSAFDPNNPGVLSANQTTIKLCGNGTWTVGLGATDASQCLTPPGFYTSGNTTQPCPTGTYRAGWQANATSCQTCGEGVLVDKTTLISVYTVANNTNSSMVWSNITETFLNVSGSSHDCYIQAGQGLSFLNATQSWRADNCDSNNTGVANRTYGLIPNPCKACPPGQLTSTNSTLYPMSASYFVRNLDGSGGFVSDKACINPPGVGNNGTACPQGTYSAGGSIGNCTACPGGFTTAGPGAGVTVADCGVAAGFGNVNGTIMPCPTGSFNSVNWTAGNTTTCTPCPAYTTTAQAGTVLSKDCNVLLPGYIPLEIGADGSIISAQICPQKYVCPGGRPNSTFVPSNPGVPPANETTWKLCPNGTWTIGLGATDLKQCLTPPGFYTSGNTTQQCPLGSYRAGWQASATSCQSCGVGVLADKRDSFTVYTYVGNTTILVNVSTSSADCYIQPGQGLSAQAAQNCNSNDYGVANKTYGIAPNPCRNCPPGQITSNNSALYPVSASFYVKNPDGSSGFVSDKACVNPPGFGFNGTAADKCAKGTYNAGDTYGACTACKTGFTTAAPGAGVTVADCGIAAGYGNVNGTVVPCPSGTYNNVSWTPGNATTCTPCPAGNATRPPECSCK